MCVLVGTGPQAGESIASEPDKLLQVLGNLIENAWQYTSKGGRFTITAERDAGHVRLTFANSGPALDEADLKLMFERFHRADKSRSRERGGSGIGLAIVKELIEAHGGKVGAECKPAAGAGAAQDSAEVRVWITLSD